MNLSKGEFSKIESLVIDENNMKLLNTELEPRFLLLEENLKTTHSLIQLRDYLLPKLMSGEIDVSTLEIPN